VNYLRIIHRILAPGGVWINLGMVLTLSICVISAGFLNYSHHIPGPLLWHFEENATNDPSIELDLEEVKALAAQIGFEIKVCALCVPCYLARTGLTAIRTNAELIRPM